MYDTRLSTLNFLNRSLFFRILRLLVQSMRKGKYAKIRVGQHRVISRLLRPLDDWPTILCQSLSLHGLEDNTPRVKLAGVGDLASIFTPDINPSFSKCSLALGSLNSARTWGVVIYFSARPLSGDSESSGPASRTRLRHFGG
jgi:hypothetical protein